MLDVITIPQVQAVVIWLGIGAAFEWFVSAKINRRPYKHKAVPIFLVLLWPLPLALGIAGFVAGFRATWRRRR